MKELFIFDLGGVLIKNIQVLSEMAETLGADRSELISDYRQYEEAMMAGLFPIERYYRRLEHLFKVKIDEDIFRKAFHPVLNSPVLDIVDELTGRGACCVIGSNTFLSHWYVIDELNIRRHFSHCYASHEMHAVKPYHSFFTYIMHCEGVSALNTHFTDDSPVNVEAASQLGIDAFCYQGDDEALRSRFSKYLT